MEEEEEVLPNRSYAGDWLPKTVAEALEIERLNGNTLWRDAIEKEMKEGSCASFK